MHDIEVYAAAYAGAIEPNRKDHVTVECGGTCIGMVFGRRRSRRRVVVHATLSTRGMYRYPVCDACGRRLKTLTSQ